MAESQWSSDSCAWERAALAAFYIVLCTRLLSEFSWGLCGTIGCSLTPKDSHSAVIFLPINSFEFSAIKMGEYLPCRCRHSFRVLVMCIFVSARETAGIAMQ